MTKGSRAFIAAVALGGLTLATLLAIAALAEILGIDSRLDRTMRLVVGSMSLSVLLGLAALTVLVLRQQWLGRPLVEVGPAGVAVGGTLVPWAEIDDVAAVSLYTLPHVVLAQPPSAPRRLHGLNRLHYWTLRGTRYIFLAQRQLGQDAESAAAAIRLGGLRYRARPDDESTGRATDG